MRTRALGTLFFAMTTMSVACASPSPGDSTNESADSLSGTVLIKAVHSGKCADVTGVSKADGATVQQWTCTSGANQEWRLGSAGTDIYTFVSVNSGLCLTIAGGSTANGAGVVQSAYGAGSDQKFKAISVGNGQYELQAVSSGKCLDVTGVSTANAALFQQWACGGGANQKFTLVGATTTTVDAGVDASVPDTSVPDTSVPIDTGAGSLVDKLLALTQSCSKVVSSHTYALDNGTKANICALNGAVFWKSDMDIDCDGKTTTQCNSSTDCCYFNDTAFHNNQDQPLTASSTPYIVIPGDFSYPGLDTNNGGNVVAVIYNGKLTFAVFGDTGPTDLIGEASYATAVKLGINPDPKVGGVGSGVTFITFVGNGTRPNNIEDQTETATLGAKLAAQLVANP